MLRANPSPINAFELIEKTLAGVPPAIQTAAHDAAVTLLNIVIGGSPVGIGPGSGTFKRAWTDVEMVQGGFAFGNSTHYGDILEEGLYPVAGPRTIATSKGIFSNQAPEGVLEHVVDDDQVIERLTAQIVQIMERELSHGRA